MVYDAVQSDYCHAHTHISKYKERVNGELLARGLMFNHAVSTLALFLNLPETDSKLGPLCSVALTELSIAFPEVGLNQFLAKEARAAGVALALAKASGTKAPLAAKVLERVLGPKFSLNEWKEKITAAKKDVSEARWDERHGADQLLRLDASRAPIQALIGSRNLARQAWETTMDWLDVEMDARKRAHNDSSKNTGSIPDTMSRISKISLLEKVQTLLELPKQLSKEELDQLETLYLWYAIANYVKQNVTVLRATHVTSTPAGSYRPGHSWSHIGLNNTQEKTIVDLFGPRVPRGRIFGMPAFSEASTFTRFWLAKRSHSGAFVTTKLMDKVVADINGRRSGNANATGAYA